jgi:uncharacterized protein (TIGR03083 family)
MTYEGKDTMLRVVKQEANRFFDLADRPEAWNAPTACSGWATKDVVAHIVDTTEGYFDAFDAARGGQPRDGYGLGGMAERCDQQAKALGSIPQVEMMDRLRADFAKMMGLLEPLGPDEWTGFMVTHFYMGQVPAFFFAAGQLMDYGVHSWDIREGGGQAHGLSADAADLLVPFMFALWQGTIRPDADLSPFELGIKVSGRSGCDYRISVGDGGMAYEAGRVDDLPTVIEFDAGSMVLTTFGRSNSGTVHGNPVAADRYLNLFFRI